MRHWLPGAAVGAGLPLLLLVLFLQSGPPLVPRLSLRAALLRRSTNSAAARQGDARRALLDKSQAVQAALLPPRRRQQGLFDPVLYRLYNSDLANLTHAEAGFHYWQQGGRAQGRLGRRVPLYLSYLPYGGLCNQLFGHVQGLALAAQLNATVITSVAWSRRSFTGQAVYRKQPLATLFDLLRWTGYWRERGLHILQSANTSSCVRVDLHDKRGYHHTKGGFGPLVNPSYDVRGAAALIAGHISSAVRPRLQIDPDEQLCVVVDLGNPNFASNITESASYIQPVAQGWFFAPAVVKAAESIVSKLSELGHSAFFGVHLRIEGDFTPFLKRGPTKEDPLTVYAQSMRAANFTSTSAVYVASGIFGYSSGQDVERTFIKRGVCGALFHKASMLGPRALAGLHSEQLALVDLLVLSRATAFVGDSRSTLSVFAREYRAALGHPRSTYFPVSPGLFDFLSFAA